VSASATIDVAQLAELPALVQRLQARVSELEKRLEPRRDDEPLLDVRAAAELLGMTPTALRSAAYRGSIRCVRVGRRLRFRPSELAEGR
jgi:hypothetical protein